MDSLFVIVYTVPFLIFLVILSIEINRKEFIYRTVLLTCIGALLSNIPYIGIGMVIGFPAYFIFSTILAAGYLKHLTSTLERK